jgi:hypothetical protein
MRTARPNPYEGRCPSIRRTRSPPRDADDDGPARVRSPPPPPPSPPPPPPSAAQNLVEFWTHNPDAPPTPTLSYGLIQLKPARKLRGRRAPLSSVPRPVPKTELPLPPPPPPTYPGRTPLSRWLFVYIPVCVLAGLLLYVVCELTMKQLAWRNLQRQVALLPENPINLPAAAPPAPRRDPNPGSIYGPTPTAPPAPIAAPPPPPLGPAARRPPGGVEPSELSFGMRSVVMRALP